jgi:hypothetical protein
MHQKQMLEFIPQTAEWNHRDGKVIKKGAEKDVRSTSFIPHLCMNVFYNTLEESKVYLNNKVPTDWENY